MKPIPPTAQPIIKGKLIDDALAYVVFGVAVLVVPVLLVVLVVLTVITLFK